MSLGPQWCLGVLFGCFCLGKRLALGRGHLERTWASPLGAGRRRRAAGEVARRILPMQDSGTFAALAAAKTLAASIRESVALRTLRIDRSVGLKFATRHPFGHCKHTPRLVRIKKRKKRFLRSALCSAAGSPARRNDTQHYSS